MKSYGLLLVVLSLLLLSLPACSDDDINDLAKVHTGPHNVGWDSISGSSMGLGADTVFARGPFQVAANSTLIGLGTVVSSLAGATNIKMAVYRDNAGLPAALVAATSPRPIVVGLNYLQMAPQPIPAGTYWIALLINGSVNLTSGGVPLPSKFFVSPFIGPWPNPFSGSHSTLSNDQTNAFMRIYN